jgi:transcriptional regulator with XRE-family HTH domain
MKIERMPSIDKVAAIAHVLNVSIDFLLAGGGDMTNASVQERELLNVFRALPPAGREVALKQVVALVDAFSEDAADGGEKKERTNA